MSADQRSRAAEVASALAEIGRDEGTTYAAGKDDTVAALLRGAAELPYGDLWRDHRPWYSGCRIPSGYPGPRASGTCLPCLLDDVAAAYLGEEPQP